MLTATFTLRDLPASMTHLAILLAGIPLLWSSMKIDIVSVFPEYFEVLNLSLLGKAQAKGLVTVQAHNLRDWTHDVHHSVDDTPVGGGAGMVMKPEVWSECLDDLLGLAPARLPRMPSIALPNMLAALATVKHRLPRMIRLPKFRMVPPLIRLARC